MECVICLEDNVQLYKLKPCEHTCVCKDCIRKVIIRHIRKDYKLQCPICRSKIRSVNNFKLNISDLCDDMIRYTLYYNILDISEDENRQYIIKNIYVNLYNSNPDCVPFLDKEQVKTIGDVDMLLFNPKYKLKVMKNNIRSIIDEDEDED